jgi:hypothetical protein
MELSTTHLILSLNDAIDLQIHTTYSDGTWTAEGVVDYLVSEQFELIAITDHDRVDTLVSLQGLALEKHLPILVAVEMTTTWRGEMTDILCYGFDPVNNHLNGLAQDILHRQRENTREVYENLCRKGYVFPDQHPDDLQAVLEKPSAQQPAEMVALLKRYGYGSGEISVGKILLEAGLAFATNEVAAVVDAAHRSGAVCLIAHPGRQDGFVCYDVELLDQFRREVPIDGLEVYYPLHTPDQITMYREYAEQHRLLMSAGSDSHGSDKKPIKYRAELSRSLLERVGVLVR